MVAGGVQSIEESGTNVFNYPERSSFYPQFYSALVPQQQQSNSLNDDCDYPSSSLEKSTPSRHPRCTCPSPVASKQPSAFIASEKTYRDPRCTCPTPPDSPWKPYSASPLPSPKLKCITTVLKSPGQKKFRNTKSTEVCTCPTKGDDYRHRKDSKGGGVNASVLLHPECTNFKGGFVRINNDAYYVSEASNTDIKTFKQKTTDKLEPSQGLISEVQEKLKPLYTSTASLPSSVNLAEKKANGFPPPFLLEETITNEVESRECSNKLSPAKKVKKKIITLKKKLISTLNKPVSLSPKPTDCDAIQESLDEGSDAVKSDGSCYFDTFYRDDNIAVSNLTKKLNKLDNTKQTIEYNVEKILPLSAVIAEKDTSEQTFASLLDAATNPFPIEELPKPIVDDLVSPVGSVPPLSPRSNTSLPFFTSNNDDCQTYFGQEAIAVETRPRSFSVSSKINFPIVTNKQPKSLTSSFYPNLQVNNITHQHVQRKLCSPHNVPSLFRTRSLDLRNSKCHNYKLEKGVGGDKRITPYGIQNSNLDYSASLSYRKYPRFSKDHCNNPTLRTSKASSLTNVCSQPCKCPKSSPRRTIPDLNNSPYSISDGSDYETVTINDVDGYIRLGKKLVNRWQIPHDAVSTPTLTLNHAADPLLSDTEGRSFAANETSLYQSYYCSPNGLSHPSIYDLATKYHGGLVTYNTPEQLSKVANISKGLVRGKSSNNADYNYL